MKTQWRKNCGQFKQLCLRLPFWTQVCPSLCLDFTCSVSAFHLLKRPWSMAKNRGQVAPNHTRKKSMRLRRNKRHLCWMVMRLSRNKRQLCCGRMLADDWRLVGRYDDWTVFTHRRFYTQAPLLTHTLLHTDSFTHRRFYTQALLRTGSSPHRHFYTLHVYTQMITDASTQIPLHTDAFTYRRF